MARVVSAITPDCAWSSGSEVSSTSRAEAEYCGASPR
jgi:hypothetical protein